MPETKIVESKKWYKSKTVNTNIVVILGAVAAWLQTGDLALLSPVAPALINIGLRAISSSPLE